MVKSGKQIIQLIHLLQRIQNPVERKPKRINNQIDSDKFRTLTLTTVQVWTWKNSIVLELLVLTLVPLCDTFHYQIFMVSEEYL